MPRIVPAMRVSQRMTMQSVWLVRPESTRPQLEGAPNVQKANILPRLQLQERAHAWCAQRIQTHLKGVVRSQIVRVTWATLEAMVTRVKSVKQASIRRFLGLVPVLNVQAVSIHPCRVFGLACGARQTLIHHKGALSRVIVRVKLDTTKTQVHAGNVPRENSRSRSVTRRAATVQQENIRPRLVKRPHPRASYARRANTARLQDEHRAAGYVPQASIRDNKEQKLQGSVRTVPQTRHRLQVAMMMATAQSSAHQDGLDRLALARSVPLARTRQKEGAEAVCRVQKTHTALKKGSHCVRAMPAMRG